MCHYVSWSGGPEYVANLRKHCSEIHNSMRVGDIFRLKCEVCEANGRTIYVLDLKRHCREVHSMRVGRARQPAARRSAARRAGTPHSAARRAAAGQTPIVRP